MVPVLFLIAVQGLKMNQERPQESSITPSSTEEARGKPVCPSQPMYKNINIRKDIPPSLAYSTQGFEGKVKTIEN